VSNMPEYMREARPHLLTPELREQIKQIALKRCRDGARGSKVFEEIKKQFGVSLTSATWYTVYWRYAKLHTEMATTPVPIQPRHANGDTVPAPKAAEVPMKSPVPNKDQATRAKPSGKAVGCTNQSEIGTWEATPNPDGSFRIELTIKRTPRSVLLSLQGQAFSILCPGGEE